MTDDGTESWDKWMSANDETRIPSTDVNVFSYGVELNCKKSGNSKRRKLAPFLHSVAKAPGPKYDLASPCRGERGEFSIAVWI